METGGTDSIEELECDERERWTVDLVDLEDTLRLDTRLDEEFSRHNASKANISHRQQSPMVTDQQHTFKIETLAYVRKEHDIMTNMEDFNCDAVSSSEGFALMISNQVHLLNANCTEHRATINLDCSPELISFSRDSSFLVVGDGLGSVHFIHVASKNIIFSQEIIRTHTQTKDVASDTFKMLAFASPKNSETEQLFIVLQTHIMFRFSNLHMRNLRDAIEAGDTVKAMKLKDAISIETVDLKSQHSLSVNDLSWAFEKARMTIFVAGNGQLSLTSWSLDYPTPTKLSPAIFLSDGVGRLLRGVGIMKIHTTKDGRWLVALDENGKLSLWERKSLNLLCQYHNDPIIDFNVVSSPTVTSTFCIVALTTPCDDLSPSNRYIVVILLPEFVTVHRFPVENKCWLVKPQKGLEEGTAGTTYFIEAREDSDKRDIKLYIRALNETLPLQRFQQLIFKKRFNEAEALAAHFGLDEQTVIKAKLSSILTKMNDDTKNIEWDNDLPNDLIRDLSTIKDHLFRINFCLRAIFPSYIQTYRFLCYAQQIIQDTRHKPNGIITQAVVTDVYDAMRRLGTWLLICTSLQEYTTEDGHSHINGEDERIEFDGEKWQIFRIADMIAEMRRLVGTGQISLAIAVWRRHSQDENLLLHINSILEEMPERISIHQFVPWLRNEVLPNIQRTSERMRLSSWIETRARIVESRERRPHNALELIRLLDSSSIGGKDEMHKGSWSTSNYLDTASFSPATPARFVENTVLLAHAAPYSTFGLHGSAGWATMANLKKELEDLVYLWNHDYFKISLADYSQTEPNQIALGLLDRIASPELLHDAVEKHFRPYVERNGMVFDALLATYCMEVMDSAAPWESRVLAILECIKAIDPRLDVVIELMRRTPIPWSDSTDALINNSIEISNHRRLDELREQYRLMQLKKMLLKYGIKVFNISDLSLAKGLVKFIVGQVEVETAMEDALQVVSAYHHLNKFDAYVLRLQRLYAANKLNSAFELLSRIQSVESDIQDGLPSIVFGVAQETLIWLNEVIEDLAEYREDDIYPQHAHQTFCWAIDGAVQLAQFLTKHCESMSAFKHLFTCNQKLANDLICLQLIYKEFGIILTKKELGINEMKTATAYRIIKKLSVLKNHNVMDIMDSDPEGISTKYQTISYRVADILRIPRHHVKGILAKEAAMKGDFRLAAVLCKEIFEKNPAPDTGTFLREIAACMIKYAVENPLKVYGTESSEMAPFRLTSRVLQLSQKAMSVCTEDLLSDCLDEYKSYDIQDAVFAQCAKGDYEIMLKYNENNDTAGYDPYGTPDVAGPSLSYGSRSRVNWSEDVSIEAIVLDKYGSSPFEDYYKEHGLVMDTQQAMTFVGLFVMEFGLKCFSDISLSLPSGKSKNKTDINPLLNRSAITLLTFLRQNRALQTTLRVFQRSQEYVLREKSGGDESVVDIDLFNDILDISLQRILSPRNVDQQLALGYMISLPMEKAFNTFKARMATNGSDYNRLAKFAEIGIGCAMVWKQRTFMVDCQQLKSNGRWWHQLKLLDIPFDEALFRLNQDGEYQRKLVPSLLMKTNFDLMAVLEFTRAYNIEDDYTLLEFVKGLLSSLNVDSFESQIVGVIDDIANKERFLSILIQVCVPQISPYDYERLHFVYMQIAHIDKDNIAARKSLVVLDILRNYTRINPPGPEELIDALRRMDSSEPIDLEITRQKLPRCTHRLPFHGIMEDPWKILRPELIDDSIARLLPLTIPLDLSTDTFYVSVVNNLLDQMNEKYTSMQSEENAIKFSDFRSPILKIRDLELATSLSKYISDAFPYGTDKIYSLRLAVAIAEKCHQKMEGPGGTDEAKRKTGTALNMLRKSLAQIETEFQLRSLNLAEVAEFITEPINLIAELYSRKGEEALLEKTSFDLHALTSDIARRHGLPIEKMRQHLLQTWLTQKVEGQGEPEEDLPSMRVQFGQSNVSQHEMSVQMRILYLFRTDMLEKSITFLLKFAYEGKSMQNVTTLARVRALSVLFQLASPQEINRVQKIQEVRTYMQMLLYLADFEALCIPQTLKEFSSSNKEALARSLWVNYSENPKVVQLLCNICLDYQIYDVALWDNAFQRLVQFKMFKYLLGILEHVTAISDLMQMKSMPRLWSSVILGSFKSCINQGALDFESLKLARIFTLVQKCPFLPELDIGELAKLFKATVLRADLALLSFSVLPIDNEIVKTHVKSIVASLTSKEIIEVLNIFREQIQVPKNYFNGVFDCGISKLFILNTVYAHIDAQGYYAALLNTDHMHDFIVFLIRNDRLDKIVLASARIGKWKEVQRLIGLYYKIRGTKRKAKDLMDEEDNEDLLQRFVRQRGLEIDIAARDSSLTL